MSKQQAAWQRRVVICLVVLHGSFVRADVGVALPHLHLPDSQTARVYEGNWHNTLAPCKRDLKPADPASPHSEVDRPWKVDVAGHYPGWYPGVDVKHQAAAYLACSGDLDLVLKAWDLSTRYMMPDGGIKPSTMHNNPQGVWPESTIDGSRVYYPLRLVATIDYLLLGEMIFRFSQDRAWLDNNIGLLRHSRDFLAGWIDDDGLLQSYSYDLDQVYRDIDGVAQASAYLALTKLAALENVLGNDEHRHIALELAKRLKRASRDHFFDHSRGYFLEHLAYNNVAAESRLGEVIGASSHQGSENAPGKAIDGIVGMGIDAFGVGIGAAGKHEWAAKDQTVDAWIQIGLKEPTSISKAILVNRTDFQVQPGERFKKGRLEFSDGSPSVAVEFTPFTISRAFVSFSPRRVEWVRFIGTEMQGEGGNAAGLAEFCLIPADMPYERFSHGMTDTNLAMLAFNVAGQELADKVWQYFQSHESSFYESNGLFAPTWIAEDVRSYLPSELNKRAPYKDCVAMARIWRYDSLMRRRMNDGEGIYRTIQYANTLYDRPSGGGAGWFAERYGLGRFQPGDEAQATVAKYAGYPAIYNAIIVQEALLGLSVDIDGVIHLEPCVPRDWYEAGFGADGCHVLHRHRLGFRYSRGKVEGTVQGPPGEKKLSILLPPELFHDHCSLTVDGRNVSYSPHGRHATFAINVAGEEPVTFVLSLEDRR